MMRHRPIFLIAAIALLGMGPSDCSGDCDTGIHPAAWVMVRDTSAAPALDERLTVTLQRESDTTQALVLEREVATARQAHYSLWQARSGRYRLTVAHPDYETYVQSGLVVQPRDGDCGGYATADMDVVLRRRATR